MRSIMTGLALLSLLALSVSAQIPDPSSKEATNGTSLVLNIYLDPGGRALATGYVEDPSSLPFLAGSQYDYDNQTGQLYALTNSLTSKSGDNWSINLAAEGFYQGYHTALFLPEEAKVRKINLSSGLQYSVSSTSDSLLVDVEGYGVDSPAVVLEWQQLFFPSGPSAAPPVPSAFDSYLMPSLVIAALLVGSAIFMWRRRTADGKAAWVPEGLDQLQPDQPEPVLPAAATPPSADQEGEALMVSEDIRSAPGGDTGVEAAAEEAMGQDPNARDTGAGNWAALSDQAEAGADEAQGSGEAEILPAKAIGKVPITSEMAAVLNTLTARERAVMTALLEHGGRMTQADIRYETQIPKSSLTGIVISLERRKLVTKKEWGRTNAIELSSWFLSGTEQSGKPNWETERS